MAASATKIRYSSIPAREATFKAGMAAKVHRWFRLTPSFGPGLVREMLASVGCREDEAVLDPFAGAATTLIESRLEGFRSYGFEINPFLAWVGSASLRWDLDPAAVESDLGAVGDAFAALKAEGRTVGDTGMPPIHNPTRWWRPDVVLDLMLLKEAIEAAASGQGSRDFLRLGLAGVLVPDLTNVTLGRLQLHFVDRADDEIDVWPAYSAHMATMIDDLADLERVDGVEATLWETDATNPVHGLSGGEVSCVLTSPPYPNRYSYVWNTRPHLYLLDFFSTPSEAAELDLATIGGTWGSATSVLAKGELEPAEDAVAKAVAPLVAEIREADNLMANYVLKYFNMLSAHIRAIEPLLSGDARLAYVVGCSRIKGSFVETDVLLAEIIAGLGLGFEITDIHRLRKRHSGAGLHESIVYARR